MSEQATHQALLHQMQTLLDIAPIHPSVIGQGDL
jgi:hypothetical protein